MKILNVKNELLKYLQSSNKDLKITEDDFNKDLRDFHFDSLHVVVLLDYFEKKYQIQIDLEYKPTANTFDFCLRSIYRELVKQKLFKIAKNYFSRELTNEDLAEAMPSANKIDSFDLFDVMTFLSHMENKFMVDIDSEELSTVTTINDFINLITQKIDY